MSGRVALDTKWNRTILGCKRLFRGLPNTELTRLKVSKTPGTRTVVRWAGQETSLYYTSDCVACVRVPEGQPRIAQRFIAGGVVSNGFRESRRDD